MKKVHRLFSFNEKAWLKQYIDMETELREKTKNDFEKDFFTLINALNARKYRDIKLLTTEKRRNYLVSELNYHTTKFFTENVMVIEMRKTQIQMNEVVYLEFIHEFWYDYVKQKYGETATLIFMDKNTFLI